LHPETDIATMAGGIYAQRQGKYRETPVKHYSRGLEIVRIKQWPGKGPLKQSNIGFVGSNQKLGRTY